MARIFSGIQPSGELHIGNWLGAVRNWVNLQHDFESFYSIVDLHAVTTGDTDPDRLAQQTIDMAIGLLAAGIDPEQATLFVQSHVPAHSELMWLLNAVTPVGDLERMTQYKDKSSGLKSIPAGLFNYPILQTADILLYRADTVPVGEDQFQHLELAREVARRWNQQFGGGEGFFPEPKARKTEAVRVAGLDGKGKMSKSRGNTIGLLDTPEDIWQKLRPAMTDPARKTRKDPGNPDVCNVFSLHGYFSSADTCSEVAENCRTAAWGCLDCKRVLADNVSERFAPMRERAQELKGDQERVTDLLARGATHAAAIANETMREVRERMGLLPSSVGSPSV
jgi:tryptophanyl-tRNA synthetase